MHTKLFTTFSLRRAVLFITLVLLPLTAEAQTRQSACVIEQSNYRGWQSYKLSNGLVALYVVPEIGGRTIQFQLADHGFFWVNPDLAGKVFTPAENGGGKGGWKNYGGSKVWTAPQGWTSDQEWAGPPDPVLDGGVYAAEIVAREADHVALRLTSPPDERTGVQLARTIHLYRGGSNVRVEHTMRNISSRRVRWGIWENAQNDTADPANPARFNDDFWMYAPLNPKSVHAKGFSAMFGQANHASYMPDYATRMLAVKYDNRVGKVALDSDGGWLATVNGKNDYCYIQTFTYVPGAKYPDDASVEIWLGGAGEFLINGESILNPDDPKQTPYLMESEVLSPFAELAPNQKYDYEVNWFATRCPKPVIDVTQAGAINRRLTVTRAGDGIRLEGVFGVFHKGRADAIFYDYLGAVLGRAELEAVEPNRVFRLSKQLALPAKTFRIEVVSFDEANRKRGVLGNVMIR